MIGLVRFLQITPRRPVPAKGPALSALPWALAELTRRSPCVDTGRLVVIRRKPPSDRVSVNFGSYFCETEEVFYTRSLPCFHAINQSLHNLIFSSAHIHIGYKKTHAKPIIFNIGSCWVFFYLQWPTASKTYFALEVILGRG